MKRLSINIDDDLHKCIKLEAVHKNTTVTDLVLEILKQNFTKSN